MSDKLDKLDTSNARKGGPLTPEQRVAKQTKFLKAYSNVGIVKYACKVAGISRQTYYDWRDNDEDFKALLPDAVEDAHDALEYAAHAQAVLGIEEYATNNSRVIEYNGKPVKVTKYAPALLQTLLKANLPQKYKDKHEHSGPNDGPIPVEFVTEWGGGALPEEDKEDDESEG